MSTQSHSQAASFGLSNEHLKFVSEAIDSASVELRRLNLEVNMLYTYIRLVLIA